MTDERLTHPHLEGLIRKWRDAATRLEADGFVSEAGAVDLCVQELEAALAAPPAGGVDVRMRDALVCIAAMFGEKERAALAKWEGSGTECFADPDWHSASTAELYHNIATAALSPTPNPHEADQ